MTTELVRQDAKAAQSVYVPIAEIAATLALSEARVYGLIAEGVVPALRVGRRIRVPRRTFEAWLRAQEQLALENVREPVRPSGEAALHADELRDLGVEP